MWVHRMQRDVATRALGAGGQKKAAALAASLAGAPKNHVARRCTQMQARSPALTYNPAPKSYSPWHAAACRCRRAALPRPAHAALCCCTGLHLDAVQRAVCSKARGSLMCVQFATAACSASRLAPPHTHGTRTVVSPQGKLDVLARCEL